MPADSRMVDVCDGKDAWMKDIPQAKLAFTEAMIDQLFVNGTFTIPPEGFWDGICKNTLIKGCRILWKSAGRGPNGGESTKVEYFHAIFHGWGASNRKFVVVS